MHTLFHLFHPDWNVTRAEKKKINLLHCAHAGLQPAALLHSCRHISKFQRVVYSASMSAAVCHQVGARKYNHAMLTYRIVSLCPLPLNFFLSLSEPSIWSAPVTFSSELMTDLVSRSHTVIQPNNHVNYLLALIAFCLSALGLLLPVNRTPRQDGITMGSLRSSDVQEVMLCFSLSTSLQQSDTGGCFRLIGKGGDHMISVWFPLVGQNWFPTDMSPAFNSCRSWCRR